MLLKIKKISQNPFYKRRRRDRYKPEVARTPCFQWKEWIQRGEREWERERQRKRARARERERERGVRKVGTIKYGKMSPSYFQTVFYEPAVRLATDIADHRIVLPNSCEKLCMLVNARKRIKYTCAYVHPYLLIKSQSYFLIQNSRFFLLLCAAGKQSLTLGNFVQRCVCYDIFVAELWTTRYKNAQYRYSQIHWTATFFCSETIVTLYTILKLEKHSFIKIQFFATLRKKWHKLALTLLATPQVHFKASFLKPKIKYVRKCCLNSVTSIYTNISK